MKISMEEYEEHRENYDGVCLNCEEFTSGGVEPDAENYHCEMCDEDYVIGIESAFMQGDIELKD